MYGSSVSGRRQYGGGLFVALYFIALVLVAVPALMAEMLTGRHGGGSAIGATRTLVARDGISPLWKAFGVMATVAVFLILSYYCVICGWMVDFFVFGLRGGFRGIDAAGATAVYQDMLGNPGRLASYSGMIVALAITGADHWAMLQNSIRLNVKIALGTNQFPFEPNEGTTATIAETEFYVKAGMTPLQALQLATLQAARMLEMDRMSAALPSANSRISWP